MRHDRRRTRDPSEEHRAKRLTRPDAGYVDTVSTRDENDPPDISLTFAHVLTAPGDARRAVAPILHEDGEFADRVSLATSEMVTNVVEHTSDGGRIDAWDRDPLLLAVEDYDSTMPEPHDAPTTGGGRGLRIVEQVADDWGVEATETGKIVWAEFRRTNPAAS